MPKYRIYYTVRQQYYQEIEAENAAEAEDDFYYESSLAEPQQTGWGEIEHDTVEVFENKNGEMIRDGIQ